MFKELLEQHNNKQLNEIAPLAIAAGVGLFSIGAIISNIIKEHKYKYSSCLFIKNPKYRAECQINIISAMIKQLKFASKDCNSTSNPAECKLQVIKNIEKLEEKKNILIQYAGRISRSNEISDNPKIPDVDY